MTPVRVFVPTTLSLLARWQRADFVPTDLVFTVTDAARAALPEADEEELEYLAMQQAGDAALALLAEDPDAPRLRVLLAGDAMVVAVNQPEAEVTAARGAAGLPLSRFVSLHIDDAEAIAAVAAAVAARADPERLEAALEELAEHELMWFDISELHTVLGGGADAG